MYLILVLYFCRYAKRSLISHLIVFNFVEYIILSRQNLFIFRVCVCVFYKLQSYCYIKYFYIICMKINLTLL